MVDDGTPEATAHERFTHIRLTAESVKVLAHPLRARLLSALRVSGPATATELAAELDTNTGATSYHLRKLESVGLVADTGEGSGKRRLWQASTQFHDWEPSEFDGDPDAEAALGWLVRHYAHTQTAEYDAWLDRQREWPASWRDAAGMDDSFAWLTAAQLADLRRDLDQLVKTYALMHPDDSTGRDPDARRVKLLHLAFPMDLDEEPPA